MTTELHKVPGYTQRIVLVGWPADKVPDLAPQTPTVIDGSLDSILAHEGDLLLASLVVFYPSNDILYVPPSRKEAKGTDHKRRYDEGLSILQSLITHGGSCLGGDSSVIVLLPEDMDDSDTSIWKRWMGLSLDTSAKPFPFDELYKDRKVVSQLYRWYSHQWIDVLPGKDEARLVMEGRHVRSIYTPGDGLSAMLARIDASAHVDDVDTRIRVIPVEGRPGFCSAVRIQKEQRDTYLLPSLPDPGPFVTSVVRYLFRYGISTLDEGRNIGDVIDDDWAREQVEHVMRGPNPIVGESAAILSVYPGLLDAILNPNDPILVYGPIGSGKEVLFDALRQMNDANHAFVVEDISGLDPTAVISLLFGHERGAYTGAARPRKGAVEAVGDGTLVIDNFQNASPLVQTKLLRLLEKKGEYQRLGSDIIRRSTARIVVAMNVEPLKQIAAGQFLPDLLSRFPIRITIPSLNERRVDIPLLVHALTSDYLSRTGMAETLGKTMLSPTFHLGLWMVMDWDGPMGNVRGLKNEVEQFIRGQRRAFLRRSGDPIVPREVDRSPIASSKPGVRSRRGRKKGRNIADDALQKIILDAAESNNTLNIDWVFAEIGASWPARVKKMKKTRRALDGRIGRMDDADAKQRCLDAVKRIRGFRTLPESKPAR